MKNEIGTKTDYSIESLIENAIDVLKDEYEGYDDIDDAIHEIADNEIPIYYWDIAQYMAHNQYLSHLESNDNTPIYQVIQAELYEQIYSGLSEFINSEEFQELKDKAREKE